jgi:predicted RNA binding protein YcfA (HicA-like mRNA interferase family)
MKAKQFVQKLERVGVEIDRKRGKGGHVLARYQGRWTTVPMHGSADLGPDFIKRICRQLGLNPKEVL